MKDKLSAAVSLAAAILLTFAPCARAVDGTIEINQAKVMAAGGFPYIISSAGSYRLTGNLTVSSTTADAIDVNTSNVTIDLNGFSIIGPGGSTTGGGIIGHLSANTSLTVTNGQITGFGGGSGVFWAANAVVRNVQASTNQFGIFVGDGSVISGNTANGNGGGIGCGVNCLVSGNIANDVLNGINCLSGGTISNNTANSNTNFGITCNGSGCLITGNTVDNDGTGIFAHDSTTLYGNNVLNSDTTPVSGGTSLGAKNTNLCNGTAC